MTAKYVPYRVGLKFLNFAQECPHLQRQETWAWPGKTKCVLVHQTPKQIGGLFTCRVPKREGNVANLGCEQGSRVAPKKEVSITPSIQPVSWQFTRPKIGHFLLKSDPF